MRLDETSQVGMTGFEPATTRPPAVYATGLRHIPILQFAQYSFSASPFINESSVGQPVLSVDEGPHPENEIAKIGKIKQLNPKL